MVFFFPLFFFFFFFGSLGVTKNPSLNDSTSVNNDENISDDDEIDDEEIGEISDQNEEGLLNNGNIAMNVATLIDDEQYFIQKISKKKTAKKNAANKSVTYGMSSG